MKHRLKSLILVLGVAVLLSGCSSSATPEPVDRPNLLVDVQGSVKLQRDGWSEATAVGFGALLQYDDLLEVEGQVTMLCGDLTLKTLDSGKDSCPCPPGPGPLDYKGAYYRDIPQSVPYVQHPRKTLILDTHPLLRWHDTGAGSYTVSIVQGGKTVWQQKDVVGNEMPYPTDGPLLQPGMDYLLVVVDDDSGIDSGQDPAPGIGFQLAKAEQQEALTQRNEAILALSLDPPARDYALALSYATWRPLGGERGPWGEAWLLLESVAQTHDTPAVHLWMGDVLVAMSSHDAESAYQTALQRAESLGDLESQAGACAGLWRAWGHKEYLEQALELYERLGDEDAVEALNK